MDLNDTTNFNLARNLLLKFFKVKLVKINYLIIPRVETTSVNGGL